MGISDVLGQTLTVGDAIAVAVSPGGGGASIRVGVIVGFSKPTPDARESIEIEWRTGPQTHKRTRIEADRTEKYVRMGTPTSILKSEPIKYEPEGWVHVTGATEGYEMGQVVAYRDGLVSVNMVHSQVPGRSYQGWFTEGQLSPAAEGDAP